MLNDEKEPGAQALNKDRSDKKMEDKKKITEKEKIINIINIMTRDKENIAIKREKIIKSLMSKAEFGHVPACSYDKTEECAFSRAECKEALKILCLYDLRMIEETGGCRFISKQYYYDYGRDRYAKYNDLELYDGEGVYVGTLATDFDEDIAKAIDI